MIEQCARINPRAVDLMSSGSGGTPELSGNEIILGAVGCKPHYVEALLMLHQTVSGKKIKYTQKGLADYLHVSEDKLIKMIGIGKSKNMSGALYDIDSVIELLKKLESASSISLSTEEAIFNDCYAHYIDKCKANDKKVIFKRDEIERMARIAIVSIVHKKMKEVDVYRELHVNQSKYISKYRDKYDDIHYYIYSQIRKVVNTIYNRLGKR